MAYTVPPTFVAGNVLTAAQLNTYVRDNVAWLATDSPSCRAYNSANVSIATGAFTAVTLNSERYDNAAVHDTATNTARFTVPSGGDGKYVFACGAAVAASAGGIERNLAVYKNAATVAARCGAPFSASIITFFSLFTVYSMSAADYFDMRVYQDSGGALNCLVGANYSPEAYTFWFRT